MLLFLFAYVGTWYKLIWRVFSYHSKSCFLSYSRFIQATATSSIFASQKMTITACVFSLFSRSNLGSLYLLTNFIHRLSKFSSKCCFDMEFPAQLSFSATPAKTLTVKHNRMELSQSNLTKLSILNYHPIFDNFKVKMCF